MEFTDDYRFVCDVCGAELTINVQGDGIHVKPCWNCEEILTKKIDAISVKLKNSLGKCNKFTIPNV